MSLGLKTVLFFCILAVCFVITVLIEKNKKFKDSKISIGVLLSCIVLIVVLSVTVFSDVVASLNLVI